MASIRNFLVTCSLAIGVSPIFAEIPAQLYLAGNENAEINGTTIGNWQLADPLVITTGSDIVLNAKNLEYFKLSETKGTDNNDWSGFNSGVWGPGDLVAERHFGYSMPFGKGGKQFDCPWKGDWTIEISADLTSIKYTTTTPAPEFYMLPGLDNFNDEKWKMEKEDGVQAYWIDVTDENSLSDKWVYFAIKADGNFWTNKYWQIGSEPVLNESVGCVYQTDGAVKFPSAYTGTVKLVFENTQQWGRTVEVTFFDKILEHKSPCTKLYVAGSNETTVNGVKLGNWNIVSPLEVELVEDKFTFECVNLTNLDISLRRAKSQDQDGWDLWKINRICPAEAITDSNIGKAIALKGPGEGEEAAGTTTVPYTGNWVITIDKDLKTITVTEKDAVYHLYHDGNWDNFVQDKWRFEKEENLDNVYWLDVTSLPSTSNMNIMKDGDWNHWWMSPVRPVDLNGGEMTWVYKLDKNPEGKCIPDGETYSGSIRIEVPKVAGSNSVLKARFFPSFIEHNSEGMPTGVADVLLDENADVEYYNLQGIRIANPVHGNFYIVRQGLTSKKIVY